METLRRQENGLSPDMLLEFADDFSQIQNELFIATGEYATHMANEIQDQPAAAEQPNLQEKYNLPFNPEKTLHNVGNLALIGCMGASPDEIARRVLAASAGRSELR